jgi:hypothetical protein
MILTLQCVFVVAELELRYKFCYNVFRIELKRSYWLRGKEVFERVSKMDEITFQDKLDELVKEIGTMPAPQRTKLIMLAKQTQNCHEQLKRSVDSLQDSLDYLRVSIKYLLFDLEATRRENKYLRKMLEEAS